MVRRSGGGDHLQPTKSAKLDGEVPHAARPRRNQQALACGHLEDLEGLKCGQPGQRDSGRLDDGHSDRAMGDHRRCDDQLLGMTARTGEPPEEGEDRVSRRQPLHTRAALEDGARRLAPGDVRWLLAAGCTQPASGPDLGVARVEPGGVDRDQHLALARRPRIGPVVPDLDDRGRTMTRDHRSAHGPSMPGHRPRCAALSPAVDNYDRSTGTAHGRPPSTCTQLPNDTIACEPGGRRARESTADILAVCPR